MTKLWEEYLLETEVKIHPKRKTAMSIASVGNPFDDPIYGAIGLKALGKGKGVVGKGIGIAAGVLGGAALVAGYRLIRSWFDKCTSKCGTYKVNTAPRQLCLYTCKRASLQKELALVRKSKPEKVQEVANKIRVIDKKIMLYRQYLKNKKVKK